VRGNNSLCFKDGCFPSQQKPALRGFTVPVSQEVHMAVFDLGTRSPLFTTLDLPYGFLYVEECSPLFVLSLDQVRLALKNAVERKKFSADVAETIDQAVRAAGLLENTDEVFARVLAYPIPADFVPSHRFELCTKCHAPFPHGYIRREDNGKKSADPCIGTKVEGFLLCGELTTTHEFPALDAIKVCQQILSSTLFLDEREATVAVQRLLESRVEELPEILFILGH